jgi:hypothetical protein
VAEPMNDRDFKKIRVLIGKDTIKLYISQITGEDCSEYMFRKYIEKGLFARYEDRRWIAQADNIDEFFKLWTKVQMNQYAEKLDEEAFEK